MWERYAFFGIKNFSNNKKEKYVMEENMFTRKRKMEFKDYINVILGNRGKTLSIELFDYLNIKNGGYMEDITKQAFSKQRQYIDPQFFKDLNYEVINGFIINAETNLKTWNGYYILACDGVKMEVPHHKTTYKEFNLDWKASKNNKPSRVLVSCIADCLNEFVWDTEVEEAETSEEKLIYNHISNLEKNYQTEKYILIMDRGYPSLTLLKHLDEKNIKYLIRLPKSYYKEEIKSMKTDDEYVKIEITDNRINNLNPKSQEQLKNTKEINARITKNTVKNNELVTITNLTKEELKKEEIIELYHLRWKIETAYDRLKNKQHVENFSGRTKIAILQDLYAGIFLYNYIICIKKDLEEEKNITIDLNKQINMNLLIGQIKFSFYQRILTDDKNFALQKHKEIYEFLVKRLLPKSKDETNPRKKGPQNKYKTNNRKNF